MGRILLDEAARQPGDLQPLGQGQIELHLLGRDSHRRSRIEPERLDQLVDQRRWIVGKYRQ